MRDLHDGLDVGLERAGGAVGRDRQAVVGDFPGEALDVGDHVRARPGQADVRRVDPQVVHQVQERDLLLDGRRAHRGRLQPVPERLVVEHDGARHGLVGAVPVVDERVRHGSCTLPTADWRLPTKNRRTTRQGTRGGRVPLSREATADRRGLGGGGQPAQRGRSVIRRSSIGNRQSPIGNRLNSSSPRTSPPAPSRRRSAARRR